MDKLNNSPRHKTGANKYILPLLKGFGTSAPNGPREPVLGDVTHGGGTEPA